MKQEYKVEFYNKPDGSKPAEEFLLSLDEKMRTKMLKASAMLRTNGSELREPYSKPLGSHIFELRAQVGSDITRILYFFVVGRKAILTNGFTKKTQETPRAEIERAKIYRKDYLNREENKK
jgi:phage-related protein